MEPLSRRLVTAPIGTYASLKESHKEGSGPVLRGLRCIARTRPAAITCGRLRSAQPQHGGIQQVRRPYGIPIARAVGSLLRQDYRAARGCAALITHVMGLGLPPARNDSK